MRVPFVLYRVVRNEHLTRSHYSVVFESNVGFSYSVGRRKYDRDSVIVYRLFSGIWGRDRECSGIVNTRSWETRSGNKFCLCPRMNKASRGSLFVTCSGLKHIGLGLNSVCY